MRIEVIGDDTISRQARTYAEYRVFAALTQITNADKVRHVRVLLRPIRSRTACEDIACNVTVALEGSDSLPDPNNRPYAYAAINRVVERIRTSLSTVMADRVSV